MNLRILRSAKRQLSVSIAGRPIESGREQLLSLRWQSLKFPVAVFVPVADLQLLLCSRAIRAYLAPLIDLPPPFRFLAWRSRRVLYCRVPCPAHHWEFQLLLLWRCSPELHRQSHLSWPLTCRFGTAQDAFPDLRTCFSANLTCPFVRCPTSPNSLAKNRQILNARDFIASPPTVNQLPTGNSIVPAFVQVGEQCRDRPNGTFGVGLMHSFL